MNKEYFYKLNPKLKDKDATIQDISVALRVLSSWDLFLLMIDTEPLIQDMIVAGVAEFLMDEKINPGSALRRLESYNRGDLETLCQCRQSLTFTAKEAL